MVDMEQRKDKFGRQLFKIICADCGNEDFVPFPPLKDRDCYCHSCYLNRRKRHNIY